MCANKRKICKKTILKYSFCIIYQKFDFLSEYFHIPFMLVCNWKYIIWHSEKDSCKLTVYIVANEPEREKERMGKRVSSSSWLGMENVFLLLGIGLIVFSNGVYGMSKERKASMEMEIDRKLKLLNKPAVKSIQSEDGDIIDCVDIHKQPALDHPALKKHIIQMAPKYVPEGVSPAMKKESSKTGGSEVKQIWQRSGSCPEGTIPIRRIQKKDLLRAASLQHFGRKPPSHPLQENTIKPDKSLGPNGTDVPVGPETNRSKAVLLSYEYQFLGASGAINVWKPTVDLPDDYSSGQIWLKSGNLSNYDSVESGWVVYPALYGNDQPRSFIHWTSDAYHTTGCFDLTCAGFVQTNNKISFGTALDPVSVASGPQYEIGVSIYMDPVTSNWWLDYGSETKVGYWPGTLFETLNFSAIVAEWGGEVYSSRVLNSQANHTTTQMGSGAFPTSLYGIASYVARIRNMDFSLQWKYPGDKETYVSELQCYNTFNALSGPGDEPRLFFGGSGHC